MSVIKISHKGNFSKTYKFLKKAKKINLTEKIKKYGEMGVDTLKDATPKRTGKTAESWSYEIHSTENGITIDWTNSNVNKGIHIAVLIQYGHGTRGGGYVQGIDYINPAMQPVFQKIADDLWKEVTTDGSY